MSPKLPRATRLRRTGRSPPRGRDGFPRGRNDFNGSLIVDGLFGIGLARPLAAADAALVERANAQRGHRFSALDIPSGVNRRHRRSDGARDSRAGDRDIHRVEAGVADPLTPSISAAT
jgi:hypothetical protein